MIGDPRQTNIVKGIWLDAVGLLASIFARTDFLWLGPTALFAMLGRLFGKGYEFVSGVLVALLIAAIYLLAREVASRKLGRKWFVFLAALFFGVVGFSFSLALSW